MANSQKIAGQDAMEEFEIGSGFNFSGAIINEEDAAGAGYTLVTIALDETGSIGGFEKQIGDMLRASVEACFKSPYANNLLIRVIRFGSQYSRQNGNGVDEIHGFKSLSEIDINSYPTLRGGGATPLYDAIFSAVGAMNTYAKQLYDLDFAVNGISFIITDGGENASQGAGVQMVKDELARSITGEIMESHVSILVGIDTGYGGAKNDLANFQQDAGINQFIWAGEATKDKLAKLAEFVSQSISSTSQALGTGGPSQKISATI
ncbi:hypothetical protein H6784_04415 [Candidatus Nomurabacteria bacterium]|nr:hypothetical protein [Candidatus Nomurabacteria bacterium]